MSLGLLESLRISSEEVPFFSIPSSAAARILFQCTACRADSLVHLSADCQELFHAFFLHFRWGFGPSRPRKVCQEPLLYPYPVGTLVQPTPRTPVAHLLRDAALTTGLWWYAELRTEVLSEGFQHLETSILI